MHISIDTIFSAGSRWQDKVPLTPTDKFDLVSCQFAMHYMFQSQDTAKNFFKEIATHLRENGFYLATTIDCRILTHYLAKVIYGPDTNPNITNERYEHSSYEYIKGLKGYVSTSNDLFQIKIENEFQKTLLEIEFDEENKDRLFYHHHNNGQSNKKRKLDAAFGIKYNFKLHDSETSAAVNSPEFVVPLNDELTSIIEPYGLKVFEITNFHQFYHEYCQTEESKQK
jgi:hypothetical protein